MEALLGAHLVRLRCLVRSCEYLAADEDSRSVRLMKNRESRATVWAVEFAPDGQRNRSLLLRGDYGGYLSATNLLACTGGPPGAVLAGQQLMLVGHLAPPEMLWRAARREGHVVLENHAGGYLRANGRYLRWRTAVSVADDDRSPMMIWSLEIVPLGLRSLLMDPILHEQGVEDNRRGDEEEVPQNFQSISENRGQDKQSQKQSLSDLQVDCLFLIAVKLPTRADILRLASVSRHLWKLIGSIEFDDEYYSANGTSMSELIGVLDTREVQIRALSINASVRISLDGLHNRFGIQIIDCRGGLLLLKDNLLGGMIIYDPTNGRSISLSPPPVPEECEFFAAGIAPDEHGQYSMVISLYGRGYSYLFAQDTAWIATCCFYPLVTKWTIFENEIDFNLKAVEIKSPSVVAGGELHFLDYNSSIISIDLVIPHRVRTRSMPFHRQMLTPSHILGSSRQHQLILIARDDNELAVWEYSSYNSKQNVIGGVSEYKRFKGFPQIPFFAFALGNYLLVSDLMLCFNMETGDFEVPFAIPDVEVQVRHVVPYEMAWPPRPFLEDNAS